MSDYVPIEKYRELEKENFILRKRNEKLEEERDQWSVQILDFWKKFLQNAGSCDPNLRGDSTENFQSRHITPLDKVDQNPITINTNVTRLFLTAVQQISGRECDERLSEMYKFGYWTRKNKQIRKHSTCLGPFIFEFKSLAKENIQMHIYNYDKKFTPINTEGKVRGKINHFADQKPNKVTENIPDFSNFGSDINGINLHYETSNVIDELNQLETETSSKKQQVMENVIEKLRNIRLKNYSRSVSQ